MAPGETSLGPKAVLKVLLHAAKHPHAQVLGLLLGPKGSPSVVDDAVPLFHHPPLAPLLETAFLLVEEWAGDRDKRLAGLYFAPATLAPASPSSPPPEQERQAAPPGPMAAIGEAVESRHPGALVLQLSNESLGSPELQDSLFEGWVCRSGSWVRQEGGLRVSVEGVKAFDRSLAGGKQKGPKGQVAGVVDFDEHVDDSRLDFLHQNDDKALQALLAGS